MGIQFELFPDYPRLAYTPPVPPPSEWDWLQEAWDTLYYPEENDNYIVICALTGDKLNHYSDERGTRMNAESLLKSQEATLEEEHAEKELAQSLLKSQQVALEEERTEKERERTEKELERIEKELERAMRQKMEAKLAKIENQLAQEREEAQKKIAMLQGEFEKMTEQWKK